MVHSSSPNNCHPIVSLFVSNTFAKESFCYGETLAKGAFIPFSQTDTILFSPFPFSDAL